MICICLFTRVINDDLILYISVCVSQYKDTRKINVFYCKHWDLLSTGFQDSLRILRDKWPYLWPTIKYLVSCFNTLPLSSLSNSYKPATYWNNGIILSRSLSCLPFVGFSNDIYQDQPKQTTRLNYLLQFQHWTNKLHNHDIIMDKKPFRYWRNVKSTWTL